MPLLLSFSFHGWRVRVLDLCDDGKTRSYRAHGLRKAALRALAHAGCTDEEMMAVSGHNDARQLREYLDEVDQEKMADSAIDKLVKKDAADVAREEQKVLTTYKPDRLRLQTEA